MHTSGCKRWSAVGLAAAVVAGVAGTASGQTPHPAAPPTLNWDTIVVIPDTQKYVHYLDLITLFQQMFWISGAGSPPIRMAMHVGDSVENNSHDQWELAGSAMDVLKNGHIPFVVVPGNHDNGHTPENGDFGSRRDTSEFNAHFPATGPDSFSSRDPNWHSLDGKSDNSWTSFEAGGRSFMLVNLEFAPRKQNLCRASEAIEQNSAGRPVIILTHCYQSKEGGWQDCTTRYDLIGSNGATIWNELASRHNTVQMIVSGHVTSSAVTRRNRLSGAAFVVQENDVISGGQVLEVLTDFQEVRSPIGDPNGLGFMRTLGFDAASNRVVLDTFTVRSDPQTAVDQLQEYIEHNEGRFLDGYTPTLNFQMERTFANPVLPPLDTVHDFTVNDGSAGQQKAPRIAGNKDGWMAVWEDDLNTNDIFEVKGRGFRSDGCEASDQGQKTINQVSTGQQLRPAIATGPNGERVVVWADGRDGNYDIRARGFDANGVQTFADMRVNLSTAGQQTRPDVAIASNGGFVVVWQDGTDIKGARFNASGQRQPASNTPDFAVNTVTTGTQALPRIALRRDPTSPVNGRFVVVWEDDSDGSFKIRGARFSAGASKLGWPGETGDRTIATAPTGVQRNPAIDVHNETGQVVVVWEDRTPSSFPSAIRMARFDGNGNKLPWADQVPDKIITLPNGGDRRKPQISVNKQGNFAVVWEDDLNDNGFYQIKMDGFSPNGTLIGPGINRTVNYNSKGQQLEPDVVLVDDTNQVIVAWQDDVNENGSYEIVAKEFRLEGVIETADTVEQGDPPLALMDGAPWTAVQGDIQVETTRRTVGDASLSFAPGFTEAKTPGFATRAFGTIGSKLLVDVFVPAQQPASNYKGAVQLYWSVPGANQVHQFVGQKELSPLASGGWHVLEFDLPDVMRRLFLESHNGAELAFAVNTEPGAPARTLLDNLRFGGVLIPGPGSGCASAACLAACGPGKASCDGNTDNGCETYLGDSRSHCGQCGHSCGGGLCVNGACEPAGARNIAASISFPSQGDTGYCAELTFTNQALVPVTWGVTLDLQGSTITSSWNGTFSGSQGVVSVSGAGWNNSIQPGASLHSLGFCAQRSGSGQLAAVQETNVQFQ